MSNVDAENEDFLSDEDMFSPKKRRLPTDTVAQNVHSQPGCLHRHVSVFKKLLTGVPPPPDHTNPDIHLDKILTLWEENQSLVWGGEEKDEATKLLENEQSILGFCHNVDSSCEEFESFGAQVCQRYISCETAALTSNVYIKMTQSAKKRRKANGWSQSPRTRVSYLTRRANTFQKDSIASALATASRKTQILVSNDGSKRNASASRSATELKGKRALFLSPENTNKFRTPDEGKNRRLCRQLSMQTSPYRSGQNDTCKHLNHTRSSERKRCSRSLFVGQQNNGNTNSGSDNVKKLTQNEQNANCQNQMNVLSTAHRKKMLWAVSHALKEVKISMDDPAFKPTLSRLFKATVDIWSTTNPNSDGSADKKRVSTSDAMLAAARNLVEPITGRALPKSAKKCKTPVKTKRDENNPPSSVESSCSISIAGLSGELGAFPLEHVGVLEEKRVCITGNTTSNIDCFEEKPSMVKLAGKRKRDDAGDEMPETEETNFLTPSKQSKRTPRKKIACEIVDEQSYQLLSANGSPRRKCSVPTPKRRKLNCGNFESQEPVEIISPRVLSNKTPSKDADSQKRPRRLTETPKKGKSPAYKKDDAVAQTSEISSPRVLRSRTPSKPLLKDEGRLTPAKNTKAVTPKKHDAAAQLSEISSPRVLRSRTPSKASLDDEVRLPLAKNAKASTTPKKVDADVAAQSSGTPSRVLRSRTPSKPSVDDGIQLTPAKKVKAGTPKKSRINIVDVEKSSPDDSPTEDGIRDMPKKSTPNSKKSNRTPIKSAVGLVGSSPRILRGSSPAKISADQSKPSKSRTPKKLQVVNEGSEHILSPRLRKVAQAEEEIPTMRKTRCTTLFSPRKTGDIIEIVDITPKRSKTKASKSVGGDPFGQDFDVTSPRVLRSRGTPRKEATPTPDKKKASRTMGDPSDKISPKTFKTPPKIHSTTVFADVHVDDDMPILKRQGAILRRSSRKLSIDASPSPPTLEWEFDEDEEPPFKESTKRSPRQKRTPQDKRQF